MSALVGAGTTVVVAVVWAIAVPQGRDVLGPLGTVLTWALLVGLHALLTWRAFGGLSGPRLQEALDDSGAQREATSLRPSWSVQVSAMALVVVTLLVLLPWWREHAVVLTLALVMVAASWLDMVVSFALHYAAIDRGDLDFPGDESRTFSDYLYLAVTVQATFGLPDVSALTSAMRRQLTLHTVLAFLFNTVILAVVITLLVGA